MSLIVETAVEGSFYGRSALLQLCLGVANREKHLEIMQACSGGAAKRPRKVARGDAAGFGNRFNVRPQRRAPGEKQFHLPDEAVRSVCVRGAVQPRFGRSRFELG